MLHYAERLETEYGAIEEYFARQATLLSIPLEIGVAMNMSEGQVRRVLSAAERLREQTPAVWSDLADGVIDGRRAHLISDAVGRLHRDTSIAKLNLKAIGHAAHHTSIELKSWLKKFVARTEADLFNERAEHERTQRRVETTHGDDAMSWLNAYLPGHVAAAIDKRLTFEARKINDDRTMAQRRADLLASWLTTNEHGDIALAADLHDPSRSMSVRPPTTVATRTHHRDEHVAAVRTTPPDEVTPGDPMDPALRPTSRRLSITHP